MGMLILAVLLLWAFFFSLILLLTGRKRIVQERLASIASEIESAEIEMVQERSFGERVILPLTNTIYRSVARLSKGSAKENIERKLRMIGKTGPNAAEQWLSLRLIPGLLLPAMVGLLLLRSGADPMRSFYISFVMIAMVQVGMTYYLSARTRKRKETIEKQLPDVLDIITVSVEAGLSFDSAIERVVQKSDTELSRELATTLKEMRMGKLRKLALKALAERCDVADLTIWVGAMIQADELGVGIGNVLRVQSSQMREKRRFRAREKSMKAPIKILFPLILFIFPSIFIVLLGPAALSMMKAFGK